MSYTIKSGSSHVVTVGKPGRSVPCRAAEKFSILSFSTESSDVVLVATGEFEILLLICLFVNYSKGYNELTTFSRIQIHFPFDRFLNNASFEFHLC